ncbi:uncharacterized protein LOC141851882 [Brevipalpus obovatus]|uniref:uncharacterized protein LOC141851882 n=1 Tax=Brevipalpus obovatus TaxID=246614 RepID=UPI003D9EC970
MSEFWKSLPKKYCDICKCWFADNRSSVDFHERGLRHKNNVKRKLAQVQRDGVKERRNIDKYNSDMMKIEAAAMRAFAKDVIKDPKRAKEYGASVSLTDKAKLSEKKSQPIVMVNEKTEQCQNLGREKILEAINSKIEKKAQWLESKKAQGRPLEYNPLGQWRTVEERHDSEEAIDFQLPKKRRESSKDGGLFTQHSNSWHFVGHHP